MGLLNWIGLGSRVVGAASTGAIPAWLVKTGKWLGVGTAAVAADQAVLDGTFTSKPLGWIGKNLKDNLIEKPADNLSDVAASTQSRGTFSGLFNLFNEIGMLLQILGVGGGVPETLMRIGKTGLDRPTAAGKMPNGGTVTNIFDGNSGSPILAGPTLIEAALGTAATGTAVGTGWWAGGKLKNIIQHGSFAGAGATGAVAMSSVAGGAAGAAATTAGATASTATATANAASDAKTIIQTNEYSGSRATRAAEAAKDAAATTANVADDAVRGGSKIMGALRKIPFVGKYLAIGGVATAGGAALLAPDDAQAAPLPTRITPSAVTSGATVSAGVGTLQAVGAEIGGVGLSIVGARAAAGVVANGVSTMAPSLATSLGAKAIPGIASIYAAGETLYNVGSNALKGEWKKAGLNLVSGVGETVAGIGGAATYLTVGTAWREAVRFGGAKLLGEENTIEHSTTVQAASWLADKFSDAAKGPANATTTAQPIVRKDNTGPAFAF